MNGEQSQAACNLVYKSGNYVHLSHLSSALHMSLLYL
jgi:hypothetical protein